MSYDISFKVKSENGNWFNVHDCEANITWNLRKMIEKSTGLPWLNEADNGRVVDVIPHIEHGLYELREHPELYMQYEASNGWGTIESCRQFFETILSDWWEFEANNGHYSKETLKDVHFWIV